MGGRRQGPPGDDHLLLDVGQEVGVVLASQVQTLPVQTKDPQAVEHVEQDVGLLELGHFLNRRRGGRRTHRGHMTNVVTCCSASSYGTVRIIMIIH